MFKNILVLALVLSIATIATSTSTCGSGPAIASFEADVVNRIPTDATGYTDLIA